MNEDYLEIRYSSSQTGYVTENIAAQTTAGAINLIRARVPDAQISWIKIHQAPPGRPEDRGWGGGRR